MKSLFLSAIFSLLISYSWGQLPASPYLQEFVSDVELPTEITNAGDDRLFVCGKKGEITLIKPDGTKKTFLKLEDLTAFGEGGLLGLAFHPDFKDNGHFFVFYTDDILSKISRFSISSDDQDKADISSEKEILIFNSDGFIHLGGCLRFSPDGYLIISVGDAGSYTKSQDGNSLLGKILRIDIDQGDPYSVPEDNPFLDDNNFLDEIWALGLRNPWKISFDKLTGDLWVTDVGEKLSEEINLIPAGTSGQNFGWACREGSFEGPNNDCLDNQSFVPPIAEYIHPYGRSCSASITGGFVYRGISDKLNQEGAYIFGDFCTNTISAVVKIGNDYEILDLVLNDNILDGISAFGEDQNGELYVASYGTNKIHHLDFNCKTHELEILSVASCDSMPDGCISISIPSNADISSAILLDSNGQTIPEENYCSLVNGDYTIRTFSDADACNRDHHLELEFFEPYTNVQLASDCYTNDGELYIDIDQPIRDYVTVSLENIMGESLNPDLNENLFPGDFIYTIEINTDSLSCINEIPLEVDFWDDDIQVEFINNMLVAPDSFSRYEWFFIDTSGVKNVRVLLEETSTNTFIPQKIGPYQCFAYNDNNCRHKDFWISVRELVSVENENSNKILLYPNPTDDILMIKGQGNAQKLSLIVSSVTGEMLLKESFEDSDDFLQKISLASLGTGIYFIKIFNNEYIYSSKVVVGN